MGEITADLREWLLAESYVRLLEYFGMRVGLAMCWQNTLQNKYNICIENHILPSMNETQQILTCLIKIFVPAQLNLTRVGSDTIQFDPLFFLGLLQLDQACTQPTSSILHPLPVSDQA
jgi:hypothetical protein